jgi:ankyrin repeat protein
VTTPADPSVVTAFTTAVARGYTAIVEALVAAGVDVNAQNQYEQSALCLAFQQGHRETGDWLLDHGADINKLGGDRTPLMIAAEGGDRELVEHLLDRGAGVNVVTSFGGNALMAALYNGHLDVAQLLVEGGSNVNVQTTDGTTPLKLATNAGYDELVALLKAKGAKE